MKKDDRTKLLDAITDLCKEVARVETINAESRCGCSMADERGMRIAQDELIKVMEATGL